MLKFSWKKAVLKASCKVRTIKNETRLPFYKTRLNFSPPFCLTFCKIILFTLYTFKILLPVGFNTLIFGRVDKTFLSYLRVKRCFARVYFNRHFNKNSNCSCQHCVTKCLHLWERTLSRSRGDVPIITDWAVELQK